MIYLGIYLHCINSRYFVSGHVDMFRGSNRLGQLDHKSQPRTSDCNLVLGQLVADQNLLQVMTPKGNRSKLEEI